MSLNLATILLESARSHPAKPAVIMNGRPTTYAELDAASDRFAVGLQQRGLSPGDAVALQLPNVPQFVVAYFGILKAGCVVVPMNVLYKAGEVEHVLRDSGARMVVTWAGSAEEAAKGAAGAGITDVAVLTPPGSPTSRAAGRSRSCSPPGRQARRRSSRPIRGTWRWWCTPPARQAGRRAPS